MSGPAVLKLAVKVRPHVRKVAGKLVPVAGYVRADTRPSLPPLGDCYEVALNMVVKPPKGFTDLKIVHATVRGQGPLEGIRFGHAWVEGTKQVSGHPLRVAIDRSNGNNVEWPSGMYRNIADASDIHEYTFHEAAVAAVRSGKYGPWHEDEVSRDG